MIPLKQPNVVMPLSRLTASSDSLLLPIKAELS